MSVAFRREEDDEHREPKFEIPLPPGPNLVTPRGLALTEAKVTELEAALATAVEAEREGIARTLRYWRTRKATAQLAPPPPEGEAAFGTRVTFRLDGRERTVEIVGDDEAEPALGRIAFSAPLARALIGAMPGERVPLGQREDAIELLAVEPLA